MIRFTNALPFYFMISTLHLFTPVKSSLALKATDYAVAIGIRLKLHGRENGLQRCLSTALDARHWRGMRAFLKIRLRRADERTRTADLISLTCLRIDTI